MVRTKHKGGTRTQIPLPQPPNHPDKLVEALWLHPKFYLLKDKNLLDKIRQSSTTPDFGSTWIVSDFDIHNAMAHANGILQDSFRTMKGLDDKKRHLWMTFILLQQIINFIITVEEIPFKPTTPYRALKTAYINMTMKEQKNYIDIIRLYYYSLSLEPGYRYHYVGSYCTVFINAILTYFNFRERLTTDLSTLTSKEASIVRKYARKMTVSEMLECIREIKMATVPMLNLQYTLGKHDYSHVEADFIELLNRSIKTNIDAQDKTPYLLETFIYIWFYIVQPIDYYADVRKIVSPSKYTTQCVNAFTDIPDALKDIYNYTTIINDCSVLTRKEEDTIKMYRYQLLNEYKRGYPNYTPTVNDLIIDPNQTIHITTTRPTALYRLFYHWYKYTNGKSKQEPGSPFITPIDFWSKYFNVTFEGEPGHFVGVQQDFFQVCLEQLGKESLGAFIRTEEGSERFQINRDFKPDTTFVQVLKEGISPEKHEGIHRWIDSWLFKQHFFMFAGGLITRGLLMGMELSIKLSYFTLSYVYNPGYKHPDMYILYYLLDLPKKSKTVLDLLRFSREDLVGSEMTFNFPYPITQEKPVDDPKQFKKIKQGDTSKKALYKKLLKERRAQHKKDLQFHYGITHSSGNSPKNPTITPENIREFLYRTARYSLTTLKQGEPSVVNETERNIYKKQRGFQMKLLKAFHTGFYVPFISVSMNETLGVHILDRMLHSNSYGVDGKVYLDWAFKDPTPFEIEFVELDEHMTAEEKSYVNVIRLIQKTVADVFLEDIVMNPSLTKDPDFHFPFDKIDGFEELIRGKTKADIQTIKEEFYLKNFLPNLLYFWTSNRSINPNIRYKIDFVINDPRSPNPTGQSIRTALGRLPGSHTCFNTISLPTFVADFTKEQCESFAQSPEMFNHHLHEALVDMDKVRKSLVNRLVISLYKNVGFGLAGGHASSSSRRHLKKD